jgi:trans-aconitate 2-methyltransferase
MHNKQIIEFYDNYVEAQVASGINDRIYCLYKRILKLGLNNTSNVLELGCGIGTMTFLLAKTINKGNIEAVDISDESVNYAKKHITKSNVSFITGDVVTYKPVLKQFDFITLFDVIEHIPVERHAELFKNLHNHCNSNTQILINIPNPDYIEYYRTHDPTQLQLIDQPLPLSFIVNTIGPQNLFVHYFETHSVWVKDDYQFFVIKKKNVFEEVRLANKRSFIEKIKKRFERAYVKLVHNY